MMPPRLMIGLLLALLVGCASHAAPVNPAIPVKIDGRAAVFLFVGVDCPISNSYAPELNRIIDQYSRSGIAFYLVYPDANVTLAQGKAHAAQYGYRCAVLIDPQLRFAKAMGITVTPEAAVVSRNGDLVYRGRIDDTYAALGKRRYAATTHELRDALDAVAAGRAIAVARTTAVGCSID